MRKPQVTEGTYFLLWFGGCHVDNFVHTGKKDISKLGVSSSFQANFHYSLHTGKKKGTFFFGQGGTKSLSHHYFEIWWSCEGGSEMNFLPLQETC
ncbi:uncharacterized protein TNIN_259511 [Trichonephila inaurata madagascariensis]|uniref:Uncharacterized protein n=1 Tax=Trichonephila inaurata madagascariensis TaxID=2747483 RepID=A0A8X6MCV8_9ARAC|nr:uncharacterized protein TNIN_259511 [Trichonephila inaurata madagascariensis]